MFNTKKSLFETYTRYNFYFEYIWHIHIVYQIYTTQMKVKNYTSWNIKTKPMTLVTCTSRHRKLHLKLSTFAYVFQWVKLRGRLGARLLLPVKRLRLTGAMGTGLQRRHIACCSWYHMKLIPDEMFIHKAKLQWNLPDQMFIHNVHWQWNLPEQIVIHKVNLRLNLPDQIFIHKVNLPWNLYQIKFLYIKWTCGETYQMKCLYIKQTFGETYQI